MIPAFCFPPLRFPPGLCFPLLSLVPSTRSSLPPPLSTHLVNHTPRWTHPFLPLKLLCHLPLSLYFPPPYFGQTVFLFVSPLGSLPPQFSSSRAPAFLPPVKLGPFSFLLCLVNMLPVFWQRASCEATFFWSCGGPFARVLFSFAHPPSPARAVSYSFQTLFCL